MCSIKNTPDFGGIDQSHHSLMFCNQFVLLGLETQIGTDSKYLSRSALKEIKLVDRQEFELKWKLQNVAINHYSHRHW